MSSPPTATPSSPPPEGYQRFGDYVLLDRVNVGGMAEVFRGKKLGVEGFAKMVALKRILPAIAEDEEFIEMFIDEAKLAAQMTHANVAQIFDLGNAEGRYYIAMEYVSGVDLRTVWDRARRRNRLLPIAMSCFIMQRVCEGLDYAHRKKDETGHDIGLVHRDVSPQNILVSFEGEVKVVDFGIAKAKNQVGKTQAGILKGKFGYMSPEQVRGMDLDNRSDIFACGVLLWELLVGDRLFLGESDFSTLEKVRNVEMVAPTQLNKNLSPQVERIVMKALTKGREDRYRWCSEMAEDLQRYLFESNQPFQRADLQRYMKQHFQKELDDEQGRLERYRSLSPSDLAGLAPAPAPPTSLRERPLATHAGRTQVASADAMVGEPPLDPTMAPIARPSQAPVPLGRMEPSPSPSGPVGRLSGATKRRPAWMRVALAGVVAMVLGVAGVLGAYALGVFKATPASLTVDFTPDEAEVLLNDKPVGSKSPVTIDGLVPGTYVLVLQKPNMKRVVRPIKLVEGEARMESVVLEVAEAAGSIFVRTAPKGLNIWLDAKDSGKLSPATLTGLPPGDHELVLIKEGAVVYRASVKLDTGGAEAVEIDLAKLPPIFEAKSDPPGAKVSVNNKSVGVTPLRIDTLQAGKARIKIEAKDCKPWKGEVELKQAMTSKVEQRLECKSK